MTGSLIINPSALEAGLEAAIIAKPSVSDAQRAAFERYARLRMPTRRAEGWKWSDFNAAVRRLELSEAQQQDAVISPSPFASLNPIEVRIVNGRITGDEWEGVEGLEFGIIDPGAADPEFDGHAIAALNVAMTRKAFGFKALKDATVERPILVRHINSSTTPVFSQVLGRAEDGSKLTVIETYEGFAPYHSTVFHMGVRAGAAFDRYVLQLTDAETITHGLSGCMVGEDAAYRQTSLSMGGRLCRHETHLLLPETGANVELNSAALLSGERHSDFTSLVRYNGEACKTRQLHKGVARDRGSNVFQGKFLVNRPGQKTDAQMTANGLLLSDMAEVNHKPELEIYADDVECAHGSTVGALDEDAIFYMRQRGLDEAAARALLIDAFVGEVVDGIANDGVRDVFSQEITNWLSE